MRIFWTEGAYQRHIEQKLHEDKGRSIETITRNAAIDAAIEAVHYYVCWRDFAWWKKTIREAEKAGSNKYMSLATAVAKIQEENKKGRT